MDLFLLRRAKHSAYVQLRRLGRRLQPLRRGATLVVRRNQPYRWDPTRWPGTDQHGFRPDGAPGEREVPRRLFLFWTGENEPNANRTESIQNIRRLQGDLEVILITPANLDQWLIPGHPLHDAYRGLSLVHRSDYLRSYFMFHHGGGYSDIKAHSAQWSPVYDALDRQPDLAMMGYRELAAEFTASPAGEVGRAARRNYYRVPGQCAFIFRRRSALAGQWHASVNRLLDAKLEAVVANPGGSGATRRAIRWRGPRSLVTSCSPGAWCSTDRSALTRGCSRTSTRRAIADRRSRPGPAASAPISWDCQRRPRWERNLA